MTVEIQFPDGSVRQYEMEELPAEKSRLTIDGTEYQVRSVSRPEGAANWIVELRHPPRSLGLHSPNRRR